MKILSICLILLICVNHINCGKKVAKLLAKASMRTFKKIANKSAKSFIAASLFSGIGSRNHGNSWSHDYFDQNFTTIDKTFEMLQSEIEALSNILESVEGQTEIHWYHHTIMKIVLFICIAGSITAVIWILM